METAPIKLIGGRLWDVKVLFWRQAGFVKGRVTTPLDQVMTGPCPFNQDRPRLIFHFNDFLVVGRGESHKTCYNMGGGYNGTKKHLQGRRMSTSCLVEQK
jgi:hypothetical protein